MNMMLAMEIALGYFVGSMAHDIAWNIINTIRGK